MTFMNCPLKPDLICPVEDVYGACFFCKRVNVDELPEIPVLETDIIHFME